MGGCFLAVLAFFILLICGGALLLGEELSRLIFGG